VELVAAIIPLVMEAVRKRRRSMVGPWSVDCGQWSCTAGL